MKTKKRFLFKRKVDALKIFFLSTVLRKEAIKLAVHHLYTQKGVQRQPVPSITLEELIPSSTVAEIAPYAYVDGNLSYYELIALSSMIKSFKPLNMLEIGTFNGLSTLHMALNSPSNAQIHTLDLLQIDLSYPVDESDISYILDKKKLHKKYAPYPQNKKIIEHQGNSFIYPFTLFGAPELAFIDGGHLYENVKNDTEQCFKILKKPGLMIWHDYTPDCPGVFDYLNTLSKTHKIQHIKGSSLAILAC